MADINPMDKIQSELQKGMALPKCRKCGCMKESLKSLQTSLSSLQVEASSDLLANTERWLEQMDRSNTLALAANTASQRWR